ncbi:MAG: hypothetical protein ONB25_09220 [candidate division KSB1 bacterium]|nr:hypothetical protein [candidate division KSB1 bacterium]
MEIPNLDYQCYREAVAAQATYQEEWLQVGYAPKGFYLKDHCVIKAAGLYHLFHIAGTPNVSCCLPGNELWIGHATTADFVLWETHEPCFYVRPGSWDGGHVIAPFVLEHGGRFWMFYAGCTVDNTQRIGLAVSDDLFNWERVGDGPIIRPEEYGWAFCPTSGGASCRDPHVLRLGDRFLLYYTAITNQGRACVALAESRDLLAWEDRGPCYVAEDLTPCESSNVQEMDGRYYLFFGGHVQHWSYVVSDNPWHWPAQQPRPVGKGLTGMEVVCRRDPHWLVSFFRLGKGHCSAGFRLFLGVLDWSAPLPWIDQVVSPEQLRRFLS